MRKKEPSENQWRNGGEWTEARFNSFVKSALRSASRRWPPKFGSLADAYVGVHTNVNTGRKAKHYRCATCANLYPASMVQVDHIEAIVGNDGFTTWDDYINRLYCEKENLQILCVDCHKIKTQKEKDGRKTKAGTVREKT